MSFIGTKMNALIVWVLILNVTDKFLGGLVPPLEMLSCERH